MHDTVAVGVMHRLRELAQVQDETGEAIRDAVAAGMAVPEIADLVGLSTQRVYQHRAQQ